MCWPNSSRRRRHRALPLAQDGVSSQNIEVSTQPQGICFHPTQTRTEIAFPTMPTISPAQPYFIPFRFPLLPTKMSYDNHADGFWDFPERAGWILDGQREYRKFHNELTEALNPVLVKMDNKSYQCRKRIIPKSFVETRPSDALSIKCFKKDGTQTPLSEQVAFLQSWSFFGVLTELNTITGVPTPDFGAEGTPVILLTTAFDALVCSWVAAIKALSSDDDRRREKWNQILEVIQHVVSLQICISTVRSQVKEPQRLTYDECKVLLAICVLFRAILLALTLSSSSEAKPDLQLIMEPALAQSFPANWDELKDYATNEMLAAGWCWSESTLLEQYSGVYNVFAARLTAGRWRVDHSKCHNRLCAADYVNEETYTTVHVQEGCGCEWVQVKSEELCQVLDHGQVPRIVVSKDMKLDVVDDQPYVAISHVWAHGLGNPHENALPRCQVERLATYILGLQVTGELPDLAIWMDTLCIPVHPDLKSYRKMAIKLMSQTYRNEAAVLVLDRELQRIDTSDVSLLERDLIMAFVGWTGRLWTLQEAALADRLYVQTLRSSYKLDNTVSEEADEHGLAAHICFWQDIAALTRRRIPAIAMLRQSVFEELAHAVKHRSTSKREDEALVLAITLGLDVDLILDTPGVDTRMATLLMLLKDVPADIIFGNWPKLAQAPFRWAPRSLLGSPRQALQSFGPAATCDTHGLHATYEAFTVEHEARVTAQEDVFVIDNASEMKYRFRTRDGDAVVPFPEMCALIFRAYSIGGATAVARVLCRRGGENGEDVIEVEVVGLLDMVGSGGGLHVAGQRVPEGALTSSNQRWRIT